MKMGQVRDISSTKHKILDCPLHSASMTDRLKRKEFGVINEKWFILQQIIEILRDHNFKGIVLNITDQGTHFISPSGGGNGFWRCNIQLKTNSTKLCACLSDLKPDLKETNDIQLLVKQESLTGVKGHRLGVYFECNYRFVAEFGCPSDVV